MCLGFGNVKDVTDGRPTYTRILCRLRYTTAVEIASCLGNFLVGDTARLAICNVVVPIALGFPSPF